MHTGKQSNVVFSTQSLSQVNAQALVLLTKDDSNLWQQL